MPCRPRPGARPPERRPARATVSVSGLRRPAATCPSSTCHPTRRTSRRRRPTGSRLAVSGLATDLRVVRRHLAHRRACEPAAPSREIGSRVGPSFAQRLRRPLDPVLDQLTEDGRAAFPGVDDLVHDRIRGPGTVPAGEVFPVGLHLADDGRRPLRQVIASPNQSDHDDQPGDDSADSSIPFSSP